MPAWSRSRRHRRSRIPDKKSGGDAAFSHAGGVRLLEAVLKACGDDLSTENILTQAYAIKDLELPMLLPGIKVDTSPIDHVPVDQMQFMRFNGKTWERFGELLTGN